MLVPRSPDVATEAVERGVTLPFSALIASPDLFAMAALSRRR